MAYDSIQREDLFKILEEFGVYDERLTMIKEALTDVYTNINLLEHSELFEIKTGIHKEMVYRLSLIHI